MSVQLGDSIADGGDGFVGFGRCIVEGFSEYRRVKEAECLLC